MASSKSVSVCLSPALLKYYTIEASVVVVIDILRATSTIVTALANNAKCIIPVDNIDTCKRLSHTLNAISAGERNGKIIEGLEKGNSASEYMHADIHNRIIVLTTTNGTKTIHMAIEKGHSNILIGSFLNLSAISEYLLNNYAHHVILVCSGWKNHINIEDTLYAGALVSQIKKRYTLDCDGAIMAHIFYEQNKAQIQRIISQSSHYKRLQQYYPKEDLGFYFEQNIYPIIPFYSDKKIIVK